MSPCSRPSRSALWQTTALLVGSALLLLGGAAAPCAAQTKAQTREVVRIIDSFLAQRYAKQQPPRQVVVVQPTFRRYEESNLQVQLPTRPWMEVQTDRRQPGQNVTFVRNNPNITVLICGEGVGVEANLVEHELVEIQKNNLIRQRPEVRFVREHRELVNGIPGTTYEAQDEAGHEDEYWVHWTGTRNGYIYQIDVSGHPRYKTQLRNVCRYFQLRVRQIDPKRVDHVEAGKVVTKLQTKFRSEPFSYEVDLTGKGWTNWVLFDVEVPGGEFGAHHRATGAKMVVLSVPMPGRKPETEAVTKALLARLGLEYPSERITVVGPCQVGQLTGQRLRATQTINLSRRHLDMRVVADERAAYLIAGWAEQESAAYQNTIAAALDSVRITARELPDEVEMGPLRERAVALVLNDIGLAEYERGDYVAAVEYFRSASDYCPQDDTVVLNYVGVLADLDRSTEALLILEQREMLNPSSPLLRVFKARLLAQRSDFDAARKLYADLFAEGYTDDILVVQYLALAIESQAFDEAISIMEDVIRRRPTLEIKQACAQLYGLKGDFTTSIAKLQELRSQHPNDRGLALGLARMYLEAGKHAEAIEITQQLLETGREDEALLIIHGRAQLHLEEFSSAKRTFERALALNPHSQEADEGVRIASGLLGEGDNSSIKTPIAAVEVPPVVQEAIDQAAAEDAPDAEKYGAEELTRVTGIYFKQGEAVRKTTTRRVKLHTAGGVSRYSTLSFGFNPLRERLYVNRLVVLDEAGEVLTEGSLASYYVIDDTTSGMASTKKLVRIPVPGLKAGCVLEYTVTREDRYSSDKLTFQEVILSSGVPVGKSAFFVQGDVEHLKSATSLPVDVRVADDALYCVEANPAPYRYESKQPSVDTFLPIVWVGSADATWTSEANDYLARINSKLELDDFTRAQAHELVRDCTTDREKIAAIAAHVQQHYTYQAIEFGCRANVPNSAAKTLRLKYGDCKDHSVLMKQLLAAVGVESHLAVMKSSGQLVHELPSLDQFDHMILFVPAASVDGPENALGGLLIDATEKDADALLTPPFGIADREVLVLDPAQPRVIRTPSYPGGAGRLRVERQIELRANELSGNFDAHVQETITLSPYLAPVMRAYLRGFEAGGRREAVQDLLAEHGQLRIKHVDVQHLDAPAEPLCITLEYEVPDVLHSLTAFDDRSLVGRLPCPWERWYLQTEYVDVRETPFELRVPLVIHSSVRIQMPAGYQPAGLTHAKRSGESDFVTWRSSATQEAADLVVEYEFQLAAGRFPATSYGQYYSAMKQSLSTIQAPISLREVGLETATRPEQERSSR